MRIDSRSKSEIAVRSTRRLATTSTSPIARQDRQGQDDAAHELRDLQDADRNDQHERTELLRAARIVDSRRGADGKLKTEQGGQRTDNEHQPERSRCQQR